MKATFRAGLVGIDTLEKVAADGSVETEEVTLTLVGDGGAEVRLPCDDPRTVDTLIKRLPKEWVVTVESVE